MACSSDISKIYECYSDGRKFSSDDETADSSVSYARRYREIMHDATHGLTRGIIEIDETENIIVSGPHQPIMDMVLSRREDKTKAELSPNVYIRRVAANQYSLRDSSSPVILDIDEGILPWVFCIDKAPNYFTNLLWNLGFLKDENGLLPVLPFEDELCLEYPRYGSHKHGYGGTYRLAKQYPQLLRTSLDPIVPCEDTLELPLSSINEIALSDAMHNRRSCRDHSTPPAALEDVMTLLFLSAHGESSGKGVQNEPLYRFPYPSGGSLGELRFLVIANRMTLGGAETGETCFEYHPLSNIIYKHHVNKKALHSLIRLYSHMPGIPPEELQCLIIVLADAGKVAGKYECVAPSLIYKHVGAWMQTAYLVSTQLPLSVCALGGGPADVLPRLFGLEDSFLRPVGEMVCSRRRDDDFDNSSCS
ncbi:nitroreductase family protein [Bifidobacterium sp. ESL0784]|uniref:nitroreductase family protein n=1 Tax=Bifidobacterium sp. ESL0784 TaxID=2983231 RepID=UPI0023F96313|nr:nitroreductase family protein [Bifidobacterium sp. ESL0784]MDF7640114.1 nitroreductase family protein [Bifidobacterium sp. ESL0784]